MVYVQWSETKKKKIGKITGLGKKGGMTMQSFKESFHAMQLDP